MSTPAQINEDTAIDRLSHWARRIRAALRWRLRARGARELAAQLRIAGPLVLASLVNMGMSITDVIMMGWIGPVALAAGAVASDFYSLVFYLCAGVIGAVSAMVSQARGGRQHRVIRRMIQQGFWTAWILALPGAIAVWQAPKLLGLIGVEHAVITAAGDYAGMMAITLVPMLGVAVWRQLLAAFADTRSIFRVTLVTLGLNAAGNYVFMFGKLGFPALGLAGAGLSSALCATFMFGTLCLYVLRHPDYSRYRLLKGRLKPDWPRLRELFRIGFPIGISSLGEVGVYLLSTAVIGIFGTAALAAHAVALRMAGVLYAFPIGLSQAATVRVGLASGARNVAGRIQAMRTALGTATAAGMLALLVVVPTREFIATLFVNGSSGATPVVAQAATLLLILGAMQVFEYVGTVANGALRGVKDTRVPMWISVGAFWGIASAVGLALGFGLGLKALGIWLGLASGALAFSALLMVRLRRHGLRLRGSAALVRNPPLSALAAKA